jgi:hypothetical protein
VDRFEVSQVAAVWVGPIRETLEAHQAAKARDAYRPTTELDRFGLLCHGVEVQGWESSAQDVDDAVAAVHTQAARFCNVSESQDLLVAKSPTFHPLEKTQDCCVGLGTVRHQQVAVLGRANVPVRDHGETPDDHVLQTYGVGV